MDNLIGKFIYYYESGNRIVLRIVDIEETDEGYDVYLQFGKKLFVRELDELELEDLEL